MALHITACTGVTENQALPKAVRHLIMAQSRVLLLKFYSSPIASSILIASHVLKVCNSHNFCARTIVQQRGKKPESRLQQWRPRTQLVFHLRVTRQILLASLDPVSSSFCSNEDKKFDHRRKVGFWNHLFRGAKLFVCLCIAGIPEPWSIHVKDGEEMQLQQRGKKKVEHPQKERISIPGCPLSELFPRLSADEQLFPGRRSSPHHHYVCTRAFSFSSFCWKELS